MNLTYTTDGKLVIRGDASVVERLVADVLSIQNGTKQAKFDHAGKGAIVTIEDTPKPKPKPKAKKVDEKAEPQKLADSK